MLAIIASTFAHAHKRNEEIYLFTTKEGFFGLDGTIIPIKEGKYCTRFARLRMGTERGRI